LISGHFFIIFLGYPLSCLSNVKHHRRIQSTENNPTLE
jgi:hypothetical protein